MGEIRSFRDLVAWQKAKTLARAVYKWTADFPADERFGLTQQMRRATVSVPSNIAEGYARNGRDDYVRFLRIARGSLADLVTQAELGVELGLATPNPALTDTLEETDRILNGLIRSLA